MEDQGVPGKIDESVAWPSWVFTVITTLVLVLGLVVSFVRYHRRKQVKRTREEEYIARFSMILPGFNYRDMKKTTARKIMTNTHMSMPDIEYKATHLSCDSLAVSKDFGVRKSSTFSTNITIDHRLIADSAHEGQIDQHHGDRNAANKDNDNSESCHSFNTNTNGTGHDVNDDDNPQISHDHNAMSLKNNFTPMSLDFDKARKKNFIMYSTNDPYTLSQSEPVMYTFPSPEELQSSVSNIPVNDYYMEAGVAPPKSKSKHRKSKKGTKRNKKQLDTHRPRSLPQLDDVYFGNAAESTEDVSDLKDQETKPFNISSTDNVSKVFVKRNPLMADQSFRQSDTNIPLLKMNSLPEVYPFGGSGHQNVGSALTSDHM